MYYQLHALRWQDFEDLVVQVCHELLGIGTSQFAAGQDEGRDAYFEGTAERYPDLQEPWSGKLVIQAKHTEKADASCSDKDFVRTLLTGTKDRKSEAEKIAALREEGRCDGYLLFTNRRLPAQQADKLIDELRRKTGVSHVAILGRETISTYLDKFPEIARSFQLQTELIPAARFQIPPAKRDFTGRDQELSELRAKVREHGGALIYGMRGMGGVGKTELALKLVEEVGARPPGGGQTQDYSDGHILVELRGASDRPLSPAEALAQVIRAFEPQAQLPDSVPQLRQIYQTVLRDRRVLLLLDDAASADQVEPLLPHAGCLTIVTSRYRFALPKLHRQDLDALTEEAARELLLSLAPRLGAAADGLAKLLGRLPLALRLAGGAFAEQPGLRPADYVRMFAEREERLDEVEGAIAFNYERLDEEQRQQWRSLAVFPGGFDLAAAAAVWGVEAREAQPVLDRNLFRVSLVECRDGRYRLHDLARDFAAAQLEAEERQIAARRHAGHYVQVLDESDRLYLEGANKILEGLALFDREWRNIQTGQAWAASHADDDHEAAKHCNAYPGVGTYCLNLRLHSRNWIAWLEAAVSAAVALGDRAAEGRHLGNLGFAYDALGEFRRAIEYHEQGLEIDREIGDRRGEGTALGNLGNAYAALGEPRRAIEYHEQGLEIAREIGDRRGEGTALGNLGNAALGEPRRAIEYHEQGLEIAREIGDRRGEGAFLGNLGIAYADLGEPRRAIRFNEQGLEIAREIGDRQGEGAFLGNLGIAYADLGELRRAIEFYGQRLTIAREIGDRGGEAFDSWNLGLRYEKQGDLEQAAELMQVRVDFLREIEHPDAARAAAEVEEIRARLAGGA